MKCMIEAYDCLSACSHARDLYRVLDGFSTRICQKGLCRNRIEARKSGIQFFAQANVVLVRSDIEAGVQELCRLVLDRAGYGRIAMAHIDHANPGGEIDEAITVNVLDDRAFSL